LEKATKIAIEKIIRDLKHLLKANPSFTGYLKLNFYFGEYASIEIHQKEKRSSE